MESARLTSERTVGGRTPSAAAMSASGMSAQKRITSAARCEYGSLAMASANSPVDASEVDVSAPAAHQPKASLLTSVATMNLTHSIDDSDAKVSGWVLQRLEAMEDR